MAMIGPYNLRCASVELPTLNCAPGRPRAEISSSNSYPGLTPPLSLPANWGGYRNEPNTFYPTGVRHYVRLAANDDFEGVADAILATWLALGSAYLLDDGQGLQDVLITNSFRRTAHRLDIKIAGAQRFDPATKATTRSPRRSPARAHKAWSSAATSYRAATDCSWRCAPASARGPRS